MQKLMLTQQPQRTRAWWQWLRLLTIYVIKPSTIITITNLTIIQACFLIHDKRTTCITTVELWKSYSFHLMKEFVANPSDNVTQGKISLPPNIEEIRRGWLSGGQISRQKRHRGCTFRATHMCMHAKVARLFF